MLGDALLVLSTGTSCVDAHVDATHVVMFVEAGLVWKLLLKAVVDFCRVDQHLSEWDLFEMGSFTTERKLRDHHVENVSAETKTIS